MKHNSCQSAAEGNFIFWHCGESVIYYGITPLCHSNIAVLRIRETYTTIGCVMNRWVFLTNEPY